MPRSKQQVAGLQEWLDLRNAIWKRCGVDARENKKVLRVKAFEILGLEDDGTLDSMALVSLLLEPQIEHISAVVEDDYIGPATLAAMRMAEEEQLISSIAPIEQPLHVDPWENHGLEVHKFVYELVDEVNNLWRSWHRSSIAMFKSGLNARIEQLPDSLKMPYLNFLSGLLGAYHQDEDVAWSDLEKTVLEYKHLVFSEMFNSWK